MLYTYKSLAFVWVIIFALFAMSASGAARGWWFFLLPAAALLAPAVMLRTAVQGGPEVAFERSE